MKFVNQINNLIKDSVKKKKNTVFYGQNIDAGSCLSGLTRGLVSSHEGLTLNTPNSENTLVGFGFGLMLNGIDSVFFMKQLDFLLLGIDHIVNTYNVIRQNQPKASFTIFPVTVDSGYEGPQASLNNLDDFCSIAGIHGYSFTNKIDSEKIIGEYLLKPGFRILSTGQRLLKEDTLVLNVIYSDPSYNFFQYQQGNSLTVVCFNQALPYGVELSKRLRVDSKNISLFSVNSHLESNFDLIINNVANTKKLIVIDDSKSRNRFSECFVKKVLLQCDLKMYEMVCPKVHENLFYPRADLLEINYERIIQKVINN